jgi:hypothetical protein
MRSHFFSTSAVLVEWVLPNMIVPWVSKSRASAARPPNCQPRGAGIAKKTAAFKYAVL